MSKYIDADLYVEMQIYDDEHEEWGWWKGTIEDLLNQWTEERCPPTIEVSEDCISREYLLSKVYDMDNDNLVVDLKDIEDAPSVVPSRAEGEWVGYEIPSECSVCGHHWDEYVSGQELWHDGSVPNYCPNCGAKMRG